MKRLLALVICVLLVVPALSVVTLAKEVTGYPAFTALEGEAVAFTDVSVGSWYYGYVSAVAEKGLMIGKGNGIFDPDGYVTVPEALAVAARINAIYLTGSDEELVWEEGEWYTPYLAYWQDKEIMIPEGWDLDPAARLTVARILASALPEEALTPVNLVQEYAIPDVEDSEENAGIYRLYRAGILTGKDESGAFCPEETIRRCELAAIVARMTDTTQRRRFVLTMESEYTYGRPFTSPGNRFTLAEPIWWDEQVETSVSEQEEPDPTDDSYAYTELISVGFTCKTEKERGAGGILGQITLFPHSASRVYHVPTNEICTVEYPDGKVYDLALIFPSDVQVWLAEDNTDYMTQSAALREMVCRVRFPEGSKVTLSPNAARMALRSALETAYHNIYGELPEMPFDKPEEVIEDRLYLAWVIEHPEWIEPTAETEDYYEFPVIFPFRVYKKTGAVTKYYNGLDPFEISFDPYDPNALAFAG